MPADRTIARALAWAACVTWHRRCRGLRSAVLAGIAAAGCGHSEPVLEASIANVACEPGGHRVAVAVRVSRMVHPTGLATFPDGGVARELEARADFWLVDAANGTLARLASIERPSHMRTQFMPWVGGWSDGSPVVKLTGYPGAETSAGALRMRVLRLAAEGVPQAMPAMPEDVVLEQRAPVEPRRRTRARWVEATASSETLAVRTEREPRLRAAFVVDTLTGELRALPKPAAASASGRR